MENGPGLNSSNILARWLDGQRWNYHIKFKAHRNVYNKGINVLLYHYDVQIIYSFMALEVELAP